ncbi:hypothetical protein VNO77_01919 [Canavalia gladiata]|uniref:Uncharacterized protein n=1 Tax=Canavalia gladiata TaxID=3824 RepID=A0AAN9MS16_CANGL
MQTYVEVEQFSCNLLGEHPFSFVHYRNFLPLFSGATMQEPNVKSNRPPYTCLRICTNSSTSHLIVIKPKRDSVKPPLRSLTEDSCAMGLQIQGKGTKGSLLLLERTSAFARPCRIPFSSISIPLFLAYVVTALDMAPLIKRDAEFLQFKLKEWNQHSEPPYQELWGCLSEMITTPTFEFRESFCISEPSLPPFFFSSLQKPPKP